MRIERLLPACLLAASLAAAARPPAPTALERQAELSAQRLQLADRIAASKRRSGKSVEDPGRESEQLQRLAEAAAARGLPREAAAGFFRAQFEANKLVQYRLLGEPPRRGEAAADLDAIRARWIGSTSNCSALSGRSWTRPRARIARRGRGRRASARRAGSAWTSCTASP